MEFELDDYRSGRIKKKVKNLNYINNTGYNTNNNYNYNKKKVEKEKEKIKTENNNTNNKNNVINNQKAIYVNSKNNNYLITKLKKENENLKLILSEYESDIIKYKINEKKIRQKKIENTAVRITRKSTNIKPQQQIMKSFNNISNYANNTFTTNFYHPKNNNKFNSNNNSLLSNNNKINETQNNSNSKIGSMNSYIVHNKKIVKNTSKKSLSVFRSTSKNKSKRISNKNIYDKVKTNYKKINNGFDNIMEIKIKEKKQDINNTNNNTRINTFNNNNNSNNNNYINSKNVFTYKKKVNQNTESSIKNNLCNTERKQAENASDSNTNTEINKNVSNQNTFNRNTVFIPKQEFNLTWSRFSKKDMETSFENCRSQKSPPQSVIMSSKNIKKIEHRNNKYITNVVSKNKYSIDKFDNYNLKRKPDITPQKITINRRVITNKMKNNKNCFSSNNVSMKNIIGIHQKNQRSAFEEKNILNKNGINTSASNKMMNFNNLSNDGEIYTHKKKSSIIDSKNLQDKTEDEILKKNSYTNNKYNVTINNINNCNYYNLIQGNNKPEIKIIKKRINKNN